MIKRLSLLLVSMAVLLVAASLLVLSTSWWDRPAISEEQVRNAVMAAIQEEAPASFYITGHVDVNVTSTMRTSRVFLPGTLDWETGAVEATVRVPGRVFYGFDVRNLKAEDIVVSPSGVVHMAIPELEVHSTEPALGKMEMETNSGWVRFYAREREKRTERQAIQRIQPALYRQGVQHLSQTNQASINTAEALEKLLVPVLGATGLQNPSFEFNIDERLVLHAGG